MNRYRVLMILATLLTSAAAVNGQSLSSASLQLLREAEQPNASYTHHCPRYFPPSPPCPLPKEFDSLEEAAKAYYGAAVNDEQSWFAQTIDHGLAAWQKLRTLCQSQAKSDAECCQAARGVTAATKPAECCVEGIAGVCKNVVVPSHGVRTGTLMLGGGINSNHGIASSICIDKCPASSSGYRIFIVPVQLAPSFAGQGSATPVMDELLRQHHPSWAGSNCWVGKGELLVQVGPDGHYRDIKSFILFPPAPPKNVVSPAPCNCAKACACCESCKASKAAQVQPMKVPYPPQGTWTMPVPPPFAVREIVQIAPPPVRPAMPPVWIGPQPTPMVPGMPMSFPTPPQTRHAHFVTPDFDAHCERITHRGDTVILEGNVMLLCKKHAQPIRVEGQRIVVNMKDGSFSVESAAPHAPAGVHLRRNAIEKQHRHEVEWFMPVRGTPPQCLESAYPPMHPGQRIIQVMPVPTLQSYPQFSPPVERPR